MPVQPEAGIGIGDDVNAIDILGQPGLPALDGSLLFNLPTDSVTLVYRPLDPSPGPRVYTSWAAVVAAVNAPDLVAMNRTILCIGDLGILQVPPAFATAFAGPGVVTLSGLFAGLDGSGANGQLLIGDGATFTARSLIRVVNNLTLVSQSTSPVVTVAAGTTWLWVEQGAAYQASGTAPFFSLTAGILIVNLRGASQFLAGAQPVIQAAAGAVGAAVLYDEAIVAADTVGAAVGGFFFAQVASLGGQYERSQVAILGTHLVVATTQRTRVADTVVFLGAAPFTFTGEAQGGIVQRNGAPGAAINLPSAALFQQRRVFCNNQGPNSVNFVRSGADLIYNGGATATTLAVPVGTVTTLQAVTANRWARV